MKDTTVLEKVTQKVAKTTKPAPKIHFHPEDNLKADERIRQITPRFKMHGINDVGDKIELPKDPGYHQEAKVVGSPAVSEMKSVQSEEYLGLCITCEHRAGCMMRKNANVIWQCEEYL